MTGSRSIEVIKGQIDVANLLSHVSGRQTCSMCDCEDMLVESWTEFFKSIIQLCYVEILDWDFSVLFANGELRDPSLGPFDSRVMRRSW